MVLRHAAMVVVSAAIVAGSIVGLVDRPNDPSGAEASSGAADDSAPTTTRPKEPAEYEGFVSVAQSTFPELDLATAECIADGALPKLSPAIVATMLMDRDAPLKTTADQRAVLGGTIDECVDRATAVEVVLRHLAQLSARTPVFIGGADFSYPEWQCVDDELGEFHVGETFFSLYTAPLEFQQQLARVAVECADPTRLINWLSAWVDSTGDVLPSPWRPSDPNEAWTLSPPTPGRDCLRSTLPDDDADVAVMVEQVLLSASPVPLDGELDDLERWFSTCELPTPRRSGT